MPTDEKKKMDLNQSIQAQKTELVLIDFFASWCAPCRNLMPIIDELLQKRKDLSLIKIDIDQHPYLLSEYNITSYPTLLLYKNGRKINRRVGFCSYEELLSFIDRHKEEKNNFCC
ncbi:thioredoxin family protein [Candidatus Phytoplasma melaleucae]|uniref:Thioredoxin n=1 Tax=Candidatus Phytoplasma melaleucae TaxID=2982630 RepID=A0ABT9DEX7_9MOLU|nr:thioredoxin family protein ['Melaleuca sp.' phytoplasma]MDO8168201.1 thioredoxin family protein ['Melaleuca sp.' phytoplasma]MDV3205287.1 thioredoxin family protein [Weeping tea tree witches'-broom phytoplasma]